MNVYCEGIVQIDFNGSKFNHAYFGKLLTCIESIDSDKMEFSFDNRGWFNHNITECDFYRPNENNK